MDERAWPGTEWAVVATGDGAEVEAEAEAGDALAGAHRDLRQRMAASLSFALHVSKAGRVVADLGATDVPVRCQSIRKALMNAIIGVAVTKGLVSLDAFDEAR